MAKFNAFVAVHKDPAETVWFSPGDDVPDWAFGLVGDHVIDGSESVPEEEAEEEEVELDYSDYTKAELIEAAEAEGLDSSGTKAELIERLTA